MINYDKYKFHINVLGGLQEFIDSIKQWREQAPFMTDEEIILILDEEQSKKIGPSMWCRPWN